MTHSIGRHKPRLATSLLSAALLAAAFSGAASSAQAKDAKDAKIDYLTASFHQERLLEWGNRPNWSPDGRRIAFTKDDLVDSPAYEIDVRTKKIRCLTC